MNLVEECWRTFEQLCKDRLLDGRLVEQLGSWKVGSHSIRIAKCTKQANPYAKDAISGVKYCGNLRIQQNCCVCVVNRCRKAAYTAELSYWNRKTIVLVAQTLTR